MDILKTFEKSVRSGWELYSKNWKSLLPFILAMFALIIITSFFSGFIDKDSSPLIILAAIIIILIKSYANLVLYFSTANCINDMYDGKTRSVKEYVNNNFMPALKYLIFILALVVVYGILFLITGNILTAILSSIPGLKEFILFLVTISLFLLALPFIIILVFIQFTDREIAAGREDIIQALKNSIALVKANLFAVIVLGVMFILLFLLLTIPYSILYVIGKELEFIFSTMLPKELSILSSLISIVFYIPAYLYLSFLLNPFEFAILVKYWRLLKGKE